MFLALGVATRHTWFLLILIWLMATPRRAPRGTAKDVIGIYVQIAPQIYEDYVRTAAERGITKRRLIEAAIQRELIAPTVFAEPDYQQELPLKTA